MLATMAWATAGLAGYRVKRSDCSGGANRKTQISDARAAILRRIGFHLHDPLLSLHAGAVLGRQILTYDPLQ